MSSLPTRTTAFVTTAPNTAELQDLELPAPEGTDLVVRCIYSGLSQGTELHNYKGIFPGVVFPLVTGYQAVGEVLAVGPEATGYSVGDAVVYNFVRLPEALPSYWMGTHFSHAVVPTVPFRPVVVPAGADLASVALSAMVAVPLGGHDEIKVNLGDVVLVTGGGLVGQFAAQLARARGARVILSEPSPQRAALALAHSADEVIDPTKVDIGEAMAARTKEGPDTVIETSGISDYFEKAVEWMRPGGQLLMQGWYGKPVTFTFHPVHIKKPHVAFACGFGDMALAVDLIARGRVNVADLITKRLSPSELPETFVRLAAGDSSDLGVIVDWSKV